MHAYIYAYKLICIYIFQAEICFKCITKFIKAL